MGIISDDTKLSDPTSTISEWDKLSIQEKVEMDKRMAIYAAQVDIMDQGIGRIIETLKNQNQFENTLIIFLSDNGSSSLEVSRGESKSIDDLGTEKSYESYGESWTNVSNTPMKYYKLFEHEGGISTPLIVHWPNRIKAKGELRNQVGHVIDFMPTLLEITNTEYPQFFKNQKIVPFEGESLVPTFIQNNQHNRTIYFEHIANRGLRYGDWKLVSLGKNKFPYTTNWELYNLKSDRSETDNLAQQFPNKVEELSEKWNTWAKRTNVFPLDGRTWDDKIKNPSGVQK